MLYLICAFVGSSMLGIVMRLSQGKIRAKTSMLAVNYITCIIASYFYLGDNGIFPRVSGSGLCLTLGVINGVLFVVSLMLTQHNVKVNGVVLPAMFSKIGDLLIPFVASVLLFGEHPGVLQIIGAVLAVFAIIRMNYDPQKGENRSAVWLLVLFALDGIVGFMSKLYEEVGESTLSPQFLFYTFAVALLCCIAVILRDRERPGWWEVLFGILIGIPNYYSSLFLLKALNSIPAVVAYPIRSVGSIMVSTLAGLFLFREKLEKRHWIAFPAILAAVVLLSI